MLLFSDHCEAKGDEELPVELFAQLFTDQSECLTRYPDQSEGEFLCWRYADQSERTFLCGRHTDQSERTFLCWCHTDQSERTFLC